ncbi:uncharacterized protein LOC120346009 [Styela clava]
MSLISQPDPSDLGEESHLRGAVDDNVLNEDYFATNNLDTLSDINKQISNDTVSMTGESRDGFETIKPEKRLPETCDPQVYVDEETRMFCNQSPDVINSPRDIVSPADRGELSSPFSAKESDDMETGFDDASLSAPGDAVRRPTGFFGASTPLEYTTTPGASSSACDDNYESSGSRKKRRKTRRDMYASIPSYGNTRLNGPLRFPKPANSTQAGEMWYHDPDTSPFSPPTCPKNMNFNFGESSSRRSSSGTPAIPAFKAEYDVENAKRSKTCGNEIEILDSNNIKTEAMSNNNDTPVTSNTNGTRRRNTHHRATGITTESEPILSRQYPRKAEHLELKILVQPESQHRARYLTEGSRGPVKDTSQQGYPKVQLIGYRGSVMPILQVFVANDSGKVKPHGFYQACRVTGRNTSSCEEMEIDGTHVIEIPFKQDDDMTLNVDCVGILKLRNTDVEVRTGLRNQKRNQSVRLAFRVSVKNVITNSTKSMVTLQCTSKCISCTQPLGQPEITKKSIDRCSVEGGTEMFIIGKNFHRGTRVIYQDPEEPNGTQWSAEGEVDKDTFHQSHMVVRVPAYHDLNIVKPVNVQLLVEFQDKKCEPHIFTYTPRKEPELPKEEQKKQTADNSNPALNMSLLDGPIDRKFLAALFSKLLAGGITSQSDLPSADTHEIPKPEVQIPQGNPPLLTATSLLQNQLSNHILPNAALQSNTIEAKPTMFNLPAGISPMQNEIILQQEAASNPTPPQNINPNALINVLGSISNANTNPVQINTNVTISDPNLKVKHEQYDSAPIPVAAITPQVIPQVAQALPQPVLLANILPSTVQVSQPVTFISQIPTTSPLAMVTSPVSKPSIAQPLSTPGVVMFHSFTNADSVMQVNIEPAYTKPTASLVGGNIVAARIDAQNEPQPAIQQTHQNLFSVRVPQNATFGSDATKQNVFGNISTEVLQQNSFKNPVQSAAPQLVASTGIGLQNVTFGTAGTGLQPASQLGSFSYPTTFNNGKESQNVIHNQQNVDGNVNMQTSQDTNQPTFGDVGQGMQQIAQQTIPTFTNVAQQKFSAGLQPQTQIHQNQAFTNKTAQQSLYDETTQQFPINEQQIQSHFTDNPLHFTAGTQEQTNFNASTQQFSTGNQQQTSYEAPKHQFTVGGNQQIFNQQPQPVFSDPKLQFTVVTQHSTISQNCFNTKPQFSVANQQPEMQTSTAFSAVTQQLFQSNTQQNTMLQNQPSFSVASYQQQQKPQTDFTIEKKQFSLDHNQHSQHGINQSKQQQALITDQTMNLQQQQPVMQQQPQMTDIMHGIQNQNSQTQSNQSQHISSDTKMHVDMYVSDVPKDVTMQLAPAALQQTDTFNAQVTSQMSGVANVIENHPMEDVGSTQLSQIATGQTQQASTAQPVFHTDQASGLLNTEIPVQNQTFQSPQQSTTNIQMTNAQFTLQPQEVKMISTSIALGNFSNTNTESIQPAMVTMSMPSQVFHPQPVVETMVTQTMATANTMQTQNYTQQITTQPSQDMMTNQVGQHQTQQQVYQPPSQVQSPHQQTPTLSPLQIQQSDYTYSPTNPSTIQTCNNNDSGTMLQPQPTNSSQGLEHGPNLFAMDQLLQSIDAEKLASITGEDVQRQFQ